MLHPVPNNQPINKPISAYHHTKMNRIFRSAGFIALCGFAFVKGLPVSAQGTQPGWGEQNKLEDAEIVVEKNRVNQLPEANRNYEKFRLPPPEQKSQPVVYRYADYRLTDLKLNLPIRVLTIKPEELTKLYGNYVKLGIGNYGTPYFKGYFHNKRSKEVSYGADVSHVSSSKGPVENARVSNSALNLYGEQYSGDMTIGGKLGYAYDRYNFYGYNHDIERVSLDTLKQTFNRLGAEIYFNNQLSKGALQYRGNLGYDYVKDNYTARESNFKLNLGLGYALNENAAFNVDGDFSYISYKDAGSVGRTYFRLKPAYVRKTDLLNVTLGATLGYTNDTISTARAFNVYPNVRVAYELVDDQVQVYAGVNGDLERTTYNQLTQENPYLNQNVAVADVNKVLAAYGGVTGNLGRSVKFTAQVALQSFRNLYFFNNSPFDSSKFDVLYDNGTTSVFNFFGDLSYNQSERLRLGIKADYNRYTLDGLAQPYHRPALQMNLYGSYNLHDKIFLHSELYYISSTFGQIARPSDLLGYNLVLKETDDIVDLNLKVDYRFSDKFSTFVMANNIFGKNYQRYVNYPNKGLQAIVGISYSF